MDPALHFLRERIPLDDSAPRVVRTRVAGFAPVLGNATDTVRLAASEVASAFLRFGQAENFELRIYLGDDRFRVEVVDSMLSEKNLTIPDDPEGEVRLRILDQSTDRWGVLGDGVPSSGSRSLEKVGTRRSRLTARKCGRRGHVDLVWSRSQTIRARPIQETNVG